MHRINPANVRSLSGTTSGGTLKMNFALYLDLLGSNVFHLDNPRISGSSAAKHHGNACGWYHQAPASASGAYWHSCVAHSERKIHYQQNRRTMRNHRFCPLYRAAISFVRTVRQGQCPLWLVHPHQCPKRLFRHRSKAPLLHFYYHALKLIVIIFILQFTSPDVIIVL